MAIKELPVRLPPIVRQGVTILLWAACCALPPFLSELRAADTFTIATYNLENYHPAGVSHRRLKPDASRREVHASITAIRPDVLAVQEIAGVSALLELRDSLRSAGLDYPHWEHVQGFDTNIQVAVLSRFPIAHRRPHTNEGFLLNGRRFRVSRGFAEVTVRVNPRYQFTLFVAHLKSRLEIPQADQAELRRREAISLRRILDERLRSNPNANIAVVGDLNDLRNSDPVRTILGRGKIALIDTRPAEQPRSPSRNGAAGARTVAWTYHYQQEDTYSRIDYILLSHGMAREWRGSETYVLTSSNWGVASDHRPVVAGFVAAER